MGEMVQLTASDEHKLGAYVAKPAGTPKGAVVVIQEIFGVNPQIKRAVDSFAVEGYYAIAPALFDRFKRDIELGYSGLDGAEAFALYQLLSKDSSLKDVAAAFKHAATQVADVAVLGFCYGGLMSWLAATRGMSEGIYPKCCVAYYPGGIGDAADGTPTCPVIVHVGTDDSHIDEKQLDKLRAAHPEVPVYLYAGAHHGFAGDARTEYNPAMTQIARQRTSTFLAEYLHS